MAEEEKGEEAAAPPAKSKKKLYVIAAAVVLVVAAAAGAFFFLRPKPDPGQFTEEDAADGESGAVPEGQVGEDEFAEDEEALGAIFPLETFVVNLDAGKYLRCQVQLEFSQRDVPKRFHVKLVPIRDGIISLMSSRNAEEIGSEKGREALKTEIKDLVNEVMRKEEIKRVYFTQFVVQ